MPYNISAVHTSSTFVVRFVIATIKRVYITKIRLSRYRAAEVFPVPETASK
jgi:hypothetical protein